MTESELIVLFGLAMLALALIAVAVDWVGKPIHRRFVPKIYRYPEELRRPTDPSRTGWSDDTFAVPANPIDDQPMSYVDGSTEWSDAELVIPEPTGEAPGPAMFDDIPDTPPTVDEMVEPPVVTDDAPRAPRAPRKRVKERTAEPDDKAGERVSGWRRGQSVYNLTRDGVEPSVAVVRRRFWHNIASSDHIHMFGRTNAARLQAGRPPTRLNPRTGVLETMSLPVADYIGAGTKAPTPSWPGQDVDPFADQ